MRSAALLLALLPFAAFGGDDLTPLSDEFNDSGTLSRWQRVYAVEGWNANQLELQDINISRTGRMLMMPFTSTWFNDYRGELTFKEVQGDVVITTDVVSTQRNGTGAPRSQYSLAGIMVRAPRQVTPSTWRPGGENYVFLSLGAASTSGTFQFEVKTTVSSLSTIVIAPAAGSHAVIQVARLGPHVITLRNDGGGWVVHRRYYRPDFPSILQIGMTVYTDFPTCSTYTPYNHNSSVLRTGNADLVGSFDYFRYERPVIPVSLANANFSDAAVVSDQQLLSFLGSNANANAPSISTQPADAVLPPGATAVFRVEAGGQELTYQWKKNTVDIAGANAAVLTIANSKATDAGLYSVLVTNPAGSATSRAATLSVVARRRAVGR